MDQDDKKKAQDYLYLQNLPSSLEGLEQAGRLLAEYWKKNDVLGSPATRERIAFCLGFIEKKIDELKRNEEWVIQREEVQKSQKHSFFALLGSWAAVAVTLIVGGYTLYQQKQQHILENRPYVGTYLRSDASHSTSSRMYTDCDFKIFMVSNEFNSLIFSVPIKNYGKTPAKYIVKGFKIRRASSTQELDGLLLTSSAGYLMPEEEVLIKYQAPVQEIKLLPTTRLDDLSFEFNIIYKGQEKEDIYKTLISLKPKLFKIGSGEYCLESGNTELN